MESRNEIYDPDGDASRFLDFKIPLNLDQVLCFEHKLPEEIMHQDIEVPRPEEFESRPTSTSLPEISMNFESQSISTSLPAISMNFESQSISTSLPAISMNFQCRPTSTSLPEISMNFESQSISTSLPAISMNFESQSISTSLPAISMNFQCRPTSTSLPEISMNFESQPTTTSLPAISMNFESQPTATSLPAISMNFESRPTSLSPVSIDQIDCTNCITVKEEVVYSSSTRHVTLIVHGALGIFDHANFDVLYFSNDGRVSKTEHFRANISTQSYEQVKYSLIDCIMFHDALCAGTTNFDIPVSAVPSPAGIYPGDAIRNFFDSFVGSSCVPIENYPSENMLVESDNEAVRPLQRSALALQKKRTANMTMSEVEPYLHLTIAEAAKRLNMSETALKRVCRRHGHARWPGRQIRANNRKNAALEMNKAKIDRTHG